MLLSHTVLAVAYGGLLASAYPEPGRARVYQDAKLTNPAYIQEQASASGGVWQWVPDAPQMVMGGPPAPPGRFPGSTPPHQSPYDIPEPPHPPFPPPTEDEPKWPPRRPDHPPPPPPPGPPQSPPGPPPESPPGAPHELNLTIYQFLESTSHFSRIFKLVNYTEEITNLLNDSTAKLTFFAVPNWALPDPRPHKPHDDIQDNDVLDTLAAAEGLIHVRDGEDDDEDKKKFLRAVLKAILKYETLPTALNSSELAKNTTFATSFSIPDGSLDGQPLRVRIGSRPDVFGLQLDVNLLSKVVWPDIRTKNGLIHVVNKPVLPPPSAFQIGFLVPEVFSTATSALQRVGLTDGVDWRDVPSPDREHTNEGSPVVTFFAPTNRAFARLPRDLRIFLFSPWGEKVLKKLLQFHIVPDLVLHADYIHNVSESDAKHTRRELEGYDFLDVLGNLVHGAGEMSDGPTHAQYQYHSYDHDKKEGPWSGEPQYWPQPPLDGPWQAPPPPPPHVPSGDGRHYRYPSPPPYRKEHARYPPFEGSGPHSPPFPPPPPSHPAFERWHHYPAPFPPPPPFSEDGPHCSPPHYPPAEYKPHFPPHPQPPYHPFPYEGGHSPEGGPRFPPPPRYPPFEEHPPHFPPPPPPPPHGDHPHRPRPPRPEVVFHRNLTHPTLLADHPLSLEVVQFKHTIPIPGHSRTFYHTLTFAHGARVIVSDIPTRNGVLHIVDRLLNPRGPPKREVAPGVPGEDDEPHRGLFADGDGEEQEWEGWQEWLPRWADQA
ncbi:hypothetical protein C8Q78DRAFT_139688 [Trametes maxima]|nr:hypothetical protein C8Q78DRAFT_139688 [Trametes maxima]